MSSQRIHVYFSKSNVNKPLFPSSRVCSTTGNRQLLPILSFRHAALERNKRCLLAFLYERLERIKDVRWEYGPTIPSTVKESLCEPEIQWFNNYNKILSTYMRSIGDKGIELTCDLEPPKSLFVQVRCLEDYGKLELEDGEVITLKKNSQHYLPRLEIESLVKQGILEQIN